jgi:segregation and condensation protein A
LKERAIPPSSWQAVSDPFDTEIDFIAPEGEARLIVDVAGFEGPLDLLLTLARRQKVDLNEISISDLADQYLAFVEEARSSRLELAADYLVMAAWLTYLKSRLLLPKPAREGEPEAEMLAEELAARLRRLEIIRLAAKALMARPQLGLDVFARGAPEAMVTVTRPSIEATIHDLLTAYGARKKRLGTQILHVGTRLVWSLSEARAALERLVGGSAHWLPLDALIAALGLPPEARRTARASAFAASLELAREGRLELRQERAFGELEMRPGPALGPH